MMGSGEGTKHALSAGRKMVRPDRFELPTFWFVARRSIQLSYGRNRPQYNLRGLLFWLGNSVA